MAYDIGPTTAARPEDLRPTTLGDVWTSSIEDARKVTNQNAAYELFHGGFNEVNEQISRATGKSLSNPLGPLEASFGDVFRSLYTRGKDIETLSGVEAWKKEIEGLRVSHPDALDWDEMLATPARKAWSVMKATRENASDVSERRGLVDGSQMPGHSIPYVGPFIGAGGALISNLASDPWGQLTQIAAGLAGSLSSPIDTGVNLISFGAGGKAVSIARNAALNASINMAAQVPLSALKMDDYKAAGLPYGWKVWSEEVAGAGVAGGLLDAGVRAPARLYRVARGTSAGQGGVFRDAVTTPELPTPPPVREPIAPEVFERARQNDIEAIREIATKSGAIEDPLVKGALDFADMGGKVDADTIARLREMNIDSGEGLATLAAILNNPDAYSRTPEPVRPADAPLQVREAMQLAAERGAEIQAVTAGLDPALFRLVTDGLEAGIPRVVAAVREVVAAGVAKTENASHRLADAIQKAADDAGGMERLSAEVAIHAAADPVHAAAAMRAHPDLVDSNVRLDTDFMRTARALQVLDGDAWAMVSQGEAPPALAAEVANFAPPGQHGRVLDDLIKTGAKTREQARAVIPDLIRRDGPAPLARPGIDDPAGPEAEAQTKHLEERHKEAVDEAMAPIKERKKLESKVEDLRGEIAKLEEPAKPKAPENLFALADNPSLEAKLENIEAAAKALESLPRNGRRPLAGGYDVITYPGIGRAVYYVVGSGKKLEDWRGNINSLGRFDVKPTQRMDTTGVEVTNAYVAPAHQRKGIASAVYEMVNNDMAEFGGVSPSPRSQLSPDAQAFWGKRLGHQMFAIPDKSLSDLAKKRSELADAETGIEAITARGTPELYALVMEAREVRRERDMLRAIDDALRLASRILPEGTDVRVTNALESEGYRLDAMSDTATGDIALARYAVNPAARLGHEGVHTLVTRGLVSSSEVGLLAKAAREASVDFKEAQYREAYKDRPNLDTLIDEEAAAHYVEAVIAGKIKKPDTALARIIKAIQKAIERVKNALSGAGYKTADDIAMAILNGEAARRAPVQRWMRENGITAMAVRPMAALGDAPSIGALDSALLDIENNKPTRVHGALSSYYIPTSAERAAAAAEMAKENGYTIRAEWLDRIANAPTLERLPNYNGYAIHRINNPRKGESDYILSDPSGIRIASATMNGNEIGYVSTNPEFQRHGFASMLYDAIEANAGIKLVPSGELIHPGSQALWLARDPDAVSLVYGPSTEIGKRAREIILKRQSDSANLMFALSDREAGQSMRRDLDALGFYSKLDEVLSGFGPKDKVTAATLQQRGVKLSEIEARGLKDALDGGKSVPVADLLATAKANPVELREVNYADPNGPEIRALVKELNLQRMSLRDRQDPQRIAELESRISDLEGDEPKPKWKAYSLDPSNPSYRETVLHLPGRGGPEFIPNTAGDWGNTGGAGGAMRNPEFDRQNVVIGHFPEPNIVGHMMTSMVKHEGKPVYLIDQIQSDWGQKLRDGGVRDEAKIAELKKQIDAIADKPTTKPDGVSLDEMRAAISALHMYGSMEALRSSTDRFAQVPYGVDTAKLARHIEVIDKLPPDFVVTTLEVKRLQAELKTAEAVSPGNPLVNTTDQWTTTTLRRAIRQAAEADADYIAIPHGDTVLSYNPGDEAGMRGFYGSRTSEGIVPKNLRKLLEKIDKDAAKPQRVTALTTPSGKRSFKEPAQEDFEPNQTGFTLFPLTDTVKASVREQGQPMFAIRDTIEAEAITSIAPPLSARSNPLRAIYRRQREEIRAVEAEIGKLYTKHANDERAVLADPAYPALNTRLIDLTDAPVPPDWRADGEPRTIDDMAQEVPERAPDPDPMQTMANAYRTGGDDAVRAAYQAMSDADRLKVRILMDEQTQRPEPQRKPTATKYTAERTRNDGFDDLKLYDDKGTHIADAEVTAEGATLTIHWIETTARQLSLSDIKGIRNSIRGLYPEATTFEGVRVSGAKDANFDVGSEGRTQSVKMFAFAGEKARTADLDALARAKEMETEGKDRTAIWTDTGWFKGVDGKWRFEIDDSGLTADNGKFFWKDARNSAWEQDASGNWVFNSDKYNAAIPLDDSQAVRHEKFRSAYPDHTVSGFVGDGQKLGYAPNELGYSSSVSGGGMTNIGILGPTSDARSTAAHELQHVGQKIEGFATGGNPEMFDTGMLSIIKDALTGQSPFKRYQRLAGEVEARTVQKRMDMTADERRARPPWQDYDVPEDQQIVRFANGTSLSMFAFAGEKARTADLDALARAKEMEAAGPPRVVTKGAPGYEAYEAARTKTWLETGWWLKPDGKWGWEIDDSRATMPMRTMPGLGLETTTRGMAPNVYKHKDLYKAYPQMKKIEVEAFPFDSTSRYTADAQGNRRIDINAMTNEGRLGDAAHEFSHGIQDIEGFAQGGSPIGILANDATWTAQARQAAQLGRDLRAARAATTDPARIARLDEATRLLGQAGQRLDQQQIDVYRSLAGEVEARTVQKRAAMSRDERRSRPPWLDYDVPEDQQIVRFANGTSLSMFAFGDPPPVDGSAMRGLKMFAMGDQPVTPGLDMSPEARKKRAEAMGFDTGVTYFRGTMRGAVEDFGWANRNSPDGVSGDFDAVFITRQSNEANGYTGVLEYDTPRYEAPPTMAQRAGLRPMPDMIGGRDTGSGGGVVYPLYAKRMRKFVWDYSNPDATNARAKAVFPGYEPTGDAPNLRQARELQDALEAAGYEALSIVDGRTGREAELAVFNPTNIRSVNAAFDPANVSSPNLMFAINDNPPPLHADMEAIDHLGSLADLAKACRG